MRKINDWNENEKFSPNKIFQDVLNSSCKNRINTSCCIDTTKLAQAPIQTSCCIDTTKE